MEWTYKGHACRIDNDHEPDVIKAFHWVTTPTGETLLADLTPYDSSREIVELWIDCKYPSRQQVGTNGGSVHLEDLEKYRIRLASGVIPEQTDGPDSKITLEKMGS